MAFWPGCQIQRSQLDPLRVCVDEGPADIQVADDGEDLPLQVFGVGSSPGASGRSRDESAAGLTPESRRIRLPGYGRGRTRNAHSIGRSIRPAVQGSEPIRISVCDCPIMVSNVDVSKRLPMQAAMLKACWVSTGQRSDFADHQVDDTAAGLKTLAAGRRAQIQRRRSRSNVKRPSASSA